MSKTKGNAKAPISPKQIETSVTFVAKASQPFDGVRPLTKAERLHQAKLKHGAHQIIPMIARLASKYGLVLPSVSIDEMQSSLEQAQVIEPLLGAVSVLHQTLKDQLLVHGASAWKTATVTYAMLDAASRADVKLAKELGPVKDWFRHRSPLSKQASLEKGTTKPKTKGKSKTATKPTPAPSAVKGNGAIVAPVPETVQPKADAAYANGAAASHAVS